MSSSDFKIASDGWAASANYNATAHGRALHSDLIFFTGLLGSVTAHLLMQPGTGEGPVPVSRSSGNVKRFRRLLNGHPGEIAEVNELSLDRVEPMKRGER